MIIKTDDVNIVSAGGDGVTNTVVTQSFSRAMLPTNDVAGE